MIGFGCEMAGSPVWEAKLRHIEKIEGKWCLGLGGRHLIGRYNNQIVVGGRGRIDVGEEVRGGWSVWGGGIQSFEVTNSKDEKKN